MSEDRLITVAIFTYEKAQIVKGVLENAGIPVAIQNVNLIQPVVSSGVRIRIHEKNLPQALQILEASFLFDDLQRKSESRQAHLLVPVDFSDCSMKACRTACSIAASLHLQVVLFHVYILPDTTGMFSVTSILAVESGTDADSDMYKEVRCKAQKEMKLLVDRLSQEMKLGRLPLVDISTRWADGIPEDEIYKYAKEHDPLLIVMGTRGASHKAEELIGSVTAEVVESAGVPVLAVPENVTYLGSEKLKSVAFFTNFDRQDLLAIDTFMRLFPMARFKVHFVHIQSYDDEWNDVKLAGMMSYLTKHYSGYDVACSSIHKDNSLLDAVQSFINENHIDFLVIPTRRRNVFARLFNPGLAHKMLFHTDTPLLVIPSRKH